MGNHHSSSSQGKYDFPNPTCTLKSPDCFGRSVRSGLAHDNNTTGTRLNVPARPTRSSQSLSSRHESSSPSSNTSSSTSTTCLSSSTSASPSENNSSCSTTTTPYANGKGRRSSVDNFPEHYEGGKSKKTKGHQRSSSHHNSNSGGSSPFSCLTTPSPHPTTQHLQHHQHHQSPIYFNNTCGSAALQVPSQQQGIGVLLDAVEEAASATAVKSHNKLEKRILAVAVAVVPPNKSCMMSTTLEKFAKQLTQLTKSLEISPGKHYPENTIARSIFQKHVVPHSLIGEEHVWSFFLDYNEKSNTYLKTSAFMQGAEKIFAPITDKEQINFYVKLYGKGKSTIDRATFIDFLISAYQVSSPSASSAGRDLNNSKDFEGREWFDAVAKSCFNIKEEMSVCFVSNWILTNIPRLLIPMHKYYVNQLTAGYTRLATLKESPRKKTQVEATKGDEAAASEQTELVKGINPILMWLLISSLPSLYICTFVKKGDPQQQQLKNLNRMSSRDLLLKLLNADADADVAPDQWSLLYDGANQGLSINRFQYHVFSYKGPTLMFLKCDSNYSFLIGIDTEWKENCHFWGGEQCFVIQLKPEFRVVEMGAKSIYANFTIRGYPFGIQAGKDPRNVAIEIKPDFEYVYFKKIPCRIISMIVWGCAPPQTRTAQTEHKKWEAKESEKQKKININSSEWNDNPDKYLLELAGNYRSYGNGN